MLMTMPTMMMMTIAMMMMIVLNMMEIDHDNDDAKVTLVIHLKAQRQWTGGLVTIHEVLEIVIPYREIER